MQAIQTYLRANHSRFVQELCEYVQFPSVSAQPKHRRDMQSCARWLVKHCRRIGLNARLCPTDGHPIVVARTPRRSGSKRPHFLVYGHYDVQPPEPFELWDTPPFQPSIRGNALYARGATDNKGQHFAHLKALEAYLSVGSELPCDLTFLIEGEEEVGSTHLSKFLSANRRELACDAVVISDNGVPDREHPGLTYALRGIVALEIRILGPARDLHSGLHGGAVTNPAIVLSQLLGRVHDEDGRVLIPGFYDDVVPLTKAERQKIAAIPHDDAAYRRMLGVPALGREKGYTSLECRFARPTFEINGLTSGYQGEGSKTIIPSHASAKVTMRLVPDQKPDRVLKATEVFLRRHCPASVKLELVGGHGAEPYFVSPNSPHARAALRALRTAFEREPALLREGGSIPIVSEFKRVLRADTLLLGLALPDDNPHAPNEKLDLEMFRLGAWMSANLWQELVQ